MLNGERGKFIILLSSFNVVDLRTQRSNYITQPTAGSVCPQFVAFSRIFSPPRACLTAVRVLASLKFNDIDSSFFIRHSSFFIRHSSFFTLHSSFTLVQQLHRTAVATLQMQHLQQVQPLWQVLRTQLEPIATAVGRKIVGL
jgi:hypothetical protein